MKIETPNNDDLDKDDRKDKWRILAWVLAALFIGLATFILVQQTNTSNRQATNEAAQKFTLAQQVAAACVLKEQADDLGGLCASANQIVKEGPIGPTGETGPIGPTGETGPTGPIAFPFSFTFTAPNGTFDCTIVTQDAVASCTSK